MKLDVKKKLAAKTLGVGLDRIAFNHERIDEIKEAITRQDIRDLVKNNSIIVKDIKGRRKNTKRKNRRREGSIKKKVRNRKQEYVKITRRLRNYLKELKKQGKINRDDYYRIRKEIKNKKFKSKKSLMGNLNK
ncbi:MAG: 50S ribosomal protein L19e [Candidatus Pacearchaeota archaeon]